MNKRAAKTLTSREIRFYLHKEFRAAEIGFYLHKEFRAAGIRFYLHKEFGAARIRFCLHKLTYLKLLNPSIPKAKYVGAMLMKMAKIMTNQ